MSPQQETPFISSIDAIEATGMLKSNPVLTL
jgi:hypothetical protein